MIKNVAVNTDFTTGAPNLALADTVLGAIREPQTRWSPASLVAAIIGAATVPLTIFVTADSVRAYEVDTEAHANAMLTAMVTQGQAEFAAILTPIEGQTTKSRQFTAALLDIATTFELNGGDFADTPFGSLLMPTHPSYSAASLINRWESIISALPSENLWNVCICQKTGKAVVGQHAAVESIQDVILAVEALPGAVKKLGYALSVDAPEGEGGPSNFIWE